MHELVRAVSKIGFASRFDHRNIWSHYLVFCSGKVDNFGAASAVVVVCVADEQDLDIAEAEAERLDALADKRCGRFKIAVDENESPRRSDEIGRKIFAADVVEIAGNAKWRKWASPGGIDLRREPRDRFESAEQQETSGAGAKLHGATAGASCILAASMARSR